MAVNLVGKVMQYLTPDRIERIAAAFNLDPKSAQSVAEVSVPLLLAELASLAVQPGGAQKVVDAVRQHSGALDSRANAVGGSANQAVLADKGTQWFSSLFGDQNHSALTGALAKFCGLSQAASEALLGLFFPIVLGTISKQLGTSTLNASSLTRLLASQKDNIAAALPSGFADLLRSTGLRGALSGAAGTVSAAVNQASMAASTATDDRRPHHWCRSGASPTTAQSAHRPEDRRGARSRRPFRLRGYPSVQSHRFRHAP
jgi:hypothetical protein